MSSLKFRSNKIDRTRDDLLEEIKHSDLMNKKYQKTCKHLNYVEHLFILALTITGCISISAFPSLAYVPVGITSSEIEIKIYAITGGIKKYRSIIKKKKKKHDLILLGKDKLNTI